VLSTQMASVGLAHLVTDKRRGCGLLARYACSKVAPATPALNTLSMGAWCAGDRTLLVLECQR
jgi:hypothetical protein